MKQKQGNKTIKMCFYLFFLLTNAKKPILTNMSLFVVSDYLLPLLTTKTHTQTESFTYERTLLKT